MERPFSKSHQERLGERLIAEPTPGSADLASLRELLIYYGAILEGASERIRNELDVKTTSRIKNTGTILEKLRRSGGSTLKSMQDLAGMRIVGGPDRREQDETVARVVELFQREVREPKVIDRRANPVHGYSAVHVIVFPESVPVEVQIRTTWQHEWAEVFEKLADAVGRGIRYGEAPERMRIPVLPAGEPSPVDDVPGLNALVNQATEHDYEARGSLVKAALYGAKAIAAHELMATGSSSEAEVRLTLDGLRNGIDVLRESHDRAKDLTRRLVALGAR